MKKSPMQQVKDNFGDRASLVDELVKSVDKQRGDSSSDDVKSRLMGLSNAKLLRLYRVEQVVRESYGDRDKLEQAIVEARTTAGMTAADNFKAKLATYSKARLVDMTNMRVGEKKIRPEVERPKTKKKAAPKPAPEKAAAKKSTQKGASTKKTATAKKSTVDAGKPAKPAKRGKKKKL